jgi:murein DD-endopeptidase MepM/ murein hydrolase activator NlpD
MSLEREFHVLKIKCVGAEGFKRVAADIAVRRRSVGSAGGVVTAIGPRGTYGLYIRIDHTKSLATAYAHLSAFPPGLAIGSRVRQGQTIAFSGNTGRTTGPHLHYEVLVDNVQVDPMKMTLEQNSALAGPVLAAFRTERSRIDEMRTKGG